MVRIIDSTLREGSQTAAGPMTVEQSVEVATLLARAGVDAIECGHPAIGPEEARRVAAVVRAAGPVPVLAHARARPGDIDAAAATGAPWVGVFLGVNEMSRRYRLPGASVADLHSRIEQSIRYAHQLGMDVRFTVEDASRTGRDDLREAYRIAVASGARRICFADTVGVLEPDEVGASLAAVRRWCPDAEVEVHLHDDRGLAMANALAAVDAGVDWISTSVNGLGERAGIVDLATLTANLYRRGVRPHARGAVLLDLSRRVGAYSRSMPDRRRPVVGADAEPSWGGTAFLPAGPAGSETTGAGGHGEVSPVRRRVPLPRQPRAWIVDPVVISATELRHHRAGPGSRYVLVDDRFVPGAEQYCIARRVPKLSDYGAGHVDTHVHDCDSLFVFLGHEDGYSGLSAEVTLAGDVFTVDSPKSVLVPAGVPHGYRILAGSGTYLNHVLAGTYNASLLDPLDGVPAPGSPAPGSAGPPNTKAAGWDAIGALFWEVGRASAKPSTEEIRLFLRGLPAGAPCAVVGASTKDLVEALIAVGAAVTVLDFSERMCADLRAALPAGSCEVILLDITRPVPAALRGTQSYVLSDRLVNRFAGAEARAGVAGMLALLAEGGELRTSVKLGLYPMDRRMIDLGRRRGVLDRFYDPQAATIDFVRAGDVLDDALLPHGSIPAELLLPWYRSRGVEQRFTHDRVVDLLAGARSDGRMLELIGVEDLPDARSTRLYAARALTVPRP